MATRHIPHLALHLVNFTAENPTNNWSHMFMLAKAADVAGIDRIVTSDHVVFGEELDDYAKPEVGGRDGGKQPTGPDGHWLDPLTTLAVVAGMTSRVRLGTQILLAGLRRPVTLAKEVATLDVLSGGRVDLGVGVGWQRAEYDAAGLSFDGRGRVLDHALEVCRTLWTETRASYSSPELSFEGIHQMPKPVQAGGLPVWISGTIRGSTVRRLVEFGAGWIPWGKDDLDMSRSIPTMQDAVSKAGGDPSRLRVTGPTPVVRDAQGNVDLPATMARVAELVAIGQTDFSYPYRPLADQAANEAALREIVNAFRSAVGRPLEG